MINILKNFMRMTIFLLQVNFVPLVYSKVIKYILLAFMLGAHPTNFFHESGIGF